MSEEQGHELRPDLLDEFYSECDEHLSAIRQALSALEKQVRAGTGADASLVSALFASFHSFKGIAALAGLTPAERLAHAAEGYLRVLSRGNGAITQSGLNTLMVAAQRLEQAVGAHRAKQPLPLIEHELDQLAALVPTDEPAETVPQPAGVKPSDVLARIEEARRNSFLVWRCVFKPSRELDDRGVNINGVRARLAKLGQILEAAPKVEPGKGIKFHFVLALRAAPGDLAEWEADGLRFEPFSDPETVAETEPGSHPERAGASLHDPFIAPSRFIRVDIGRLDELMRVMGDLVIQRARLEEQISRLARQNGDAPAEPLLEVSAGLNRSLRELREAIMRVRLIPIAHLFERMPFVVRDLANDSNKRIRVELSGQATEIDKYIIERLKDPLLHLVRNAVSHGIEEPEDREERGKSPEATVRLSATTAGDSVIIRVMDDGRGIDVRSAVKRAAALGIKVPARMDPAQLLALLCRPGFSTRDAADRASGRGVGMAVAYDAVRELGGTMTLETERGNGTTFILRMPLTLAIADVFIVSAADRIYAVPQGAIAEVRELEERALRSVGKTEVLHYRNGLLPLVRLSTYFGTPSATERHQVLVMESERGLVGIVVDRVVGQREVVVRSLGDPFARARGVAGATELGDGRPVLILDVAAVTQGAARPLRNGNSPDLHIQMN
jgi:two-component system, chemotaxis family, sensor kinase CheA